jgi:hypothetical protein
MNAVFGINADSGKSEACAIVMPLKSDLIYGGIGFDACADASRV